MCMHYLGQHAPFNTNIVLLELDEENSSKYSFETCLTELNLQSSIKDFKHVLFKAFFKGDFYSDDAFWKGTPRPASWKHGYIMFYSVERDVHGYF